MELIPRRQKDQKDEHPGLWQQIPFATKLYFGILIGLFLLFGILIIMRVDFFSSIKPKEWFSFSEFFSLRDDFVSQIPTPGPGLPQLTSMSEVGIFDGPGETYEQLALLPRESIVEVVGVSAENTWYAIKISDDNQLGWVAAEMVEVNNTDRLPVLDASGQHVIEQINNQPRVISLGTTKILFGPGPDYGEIGYLEKGQEVELVGRDPEELWWVIRVPYVEGGLGWVSNDQVIAENTEDVPVATADVSLLNEKLVEDDGQLVSAIENINIRSGPGLGYNKIGVVAIGQQVSATGISPDGFWLAIRIPESSELGWISADYVVPQDFENLKIIALESISDTLIIPTPGEGKPTATAMTMVNIRKGPGLQYNILGRLEPGQQAEILGISPDKSWWLISVMVKGEDRGWVAVNFVQAVNTDGIPIIQ